MIRFRRARAIAKIAAWALSGALAIALALLCLAESHERLAGERLEVAYRQLLDELAGKRNPLELEGLALAQDVSRATGIKSIAMLRFGMRARMDGGEDLNARFNPLVWRVSISDKLETLPMPKIRSILLHEIGHAVAVARNERTEFGNDPQTRALLRESLMAHQIYHESYADLFSIAWTLRGNPRDAEAWDELSLALREPGLRASIPHNTFIALRQLSSVALATSGLPPEQLLSRIARIASSSTALSIAHNRLERESACSLGTRGYAKFARDSAYASPTLPWEVAPDTPAKAGEPYAVAIAELQALRPSAPKVNPWRQAMARSRPAVERALAASAMGASPDQVGEIARQSFYSAHRDALSIEAVAASIAAKGLGQMRRSDRETAYQWGLSLSQALGTPHAQGCVD